MTVRQARWPAYTTAVLFLGYAVGKAVYAAQGKLGFPGGPVVPAADYERYAREMMDVAAAQWMAAANGLLGAALVLLTVTGAGRRVPRALMLLVLAVALAGVGAGAVIMVADGFVGIGIGWQWHHGVIGIAAMGLLAATTHSYARATRPGHAELTGRS
ncbi:hypothetical protein [Nonomuraea sp. C10]|uniref:hypothetical protein n=1 Tax=Nonomuraea sp. C10 TaxID=2600577 RepID=UPI0011CE90FD|nr:hypothetical protein [Nonomuraea sp. C10]TXK43258.1 hypothetical protein FR742_30055 [Nonomuraea sp. C10]